MRENVQKEVQYGRVFIHPLNLTVGSDNSIAALLHDCQFSTTFPVSFVLSSFH